MTERASAPPASEMLVTMSRADLRALVLDVVQEIVDEIAQPRPTALIETQDLAVELHVSEPTIRRLRDEGMPFVRIGDSYRYELCPVLEWLRARKERQ